VRWFSHTYSVPDINAITDANSYRDGHSDSYRHGYCDSDGYCDSHADRDRDSHSNPNSYGHTHGCSDTNSNAGGNTYSFTCAQLHALDQSSVGESSARGRNRYLYRDDCADERLQFPG
jgi:hypothetical protein